MGAGWSMLGVHDHPWVPGVPGWVAHPRRSGTRSRWGGQGTWRRCGTGCWRTRPCPSGRWGPRNLGGVHPWVKVRWGVTHHHHHHEPSPSHPQSFCTPKGPPRPGEPLQAPEPRGGWWAPTGGWWGGRPWVGAHQGGRSRRSR